MSKRLAGPVFSTVIAAAVACGDGSPATGPPAISFDTLPDGSVLVTNSAKGVWDRNPEQRWRLVEALRIGSQDGEGPEAFGEVGSIVEDELGRMWVVDVLANEVRVFDAFGAFVRTVGREGVGPGEFRRIGPAFRGPNGQVWIEDIELARFEVFDTAGTRIAGHRSTSRLRGGWRHWTSDGRFLAVDVAVRPDGTDHHFVKVHVLDPQGSLRVTGVLEPPDVLSPPQPSELVVFEYPEGYRIEQVLPFTRRTELASGREADWWLLCGLCGTDSYDLIRLGEDGDTLLTIRRRYEPVIVPDAVRREALASLQQYEQGSRTTPALSLQVIPREYPPFEGFKVASDGVLWLQSHAADGTAGFDVIAPDGRFLGRPHIQTSVEGMWFHTITSGSVYAVDYDELGVNYVVRLDIEREPVRVRLPTGASASRGVPPGDGGAAGADDVTAGDRKRASRPDSTVDAATLAEVVPAGAFRDCPVCPWMIEVPPGRFLMGSPASEEQRDGVEGPQHDVVVGAFAAGVYEVTFDEWEVCVEAGACSDGPPEGIGPRGRTPVMWVSWEDTQTYLAWLSDETGEQYRLLSEAEWEYAARAGTATARFWGDLESEQCRYANGYDQVGHEEIGNLHRKPVDCADGYGRRAPVGSYFPNAFNLHDMLGNVGEWTQDCWNGGYEGAPKDGSAWESGRCDLRVVRGGSYYTVGERIRSGQRSAYSSQFANPNYGFRVARDLR